MLQELLCFSLRYLWNFGGNCILTAVFIINRLPSPLLKDKSPLEILTSKKVDNSGLRVFGCLAYCSPSPKQRNKFQPRSRSCVFLGYPAGYKGYKVMDLATNETYISWNVIFHEDIFPYAKGQDSIYTYIFSSASTTSATASAAGGIEIPIKIHDFPVDSVSSASNESNSKVDTTKTKRLSKLPSHLHDYYCHISEADTDIPYPLSAYVSYNNLSEEYKGYICAIALHPEPTSFTQTKRFDEWLQAMNEELMALEKSNTWTICSIPPDKHAIGCKWVYKINVNADGTLERYKARLVAKGYTQQESIDFVETFSPVAKMTTVKTLLAVSAAKNWHLTQLDVSNAFLNGDLHEEIYMTLPPGCTSKQGESLPANAVYRLNKSLYGLKQASRQWFLKFSATLLNLGFKKSHSDHTLFIRNINGQYIAVLVYVDDIIIASNVTHEVDQYR